MADAIWYYSRGDEQLGPVTAAQLRQLAAGGEISATDLVWKDGMEDWASASKIEGLFASTPPSQTAPISADPLPITPAVPSPVSSRVKKPMGALNVAALLSYSNYVTYPLVFAGLLFVLLARGCDTLGVRGVARAKARAKLAEDQFADIYQSRRQSTEDAIKKEDDAGKKADLREDLSKLNKEESEERSKLTKGDWRNLRIASRDEQAHNAIQGYWRQAFFLLGELMLAIGLLGVGFTSEGPQRWICFIMLLIIMMTIFGGRLSVGLG